MYGTAWSRRDRLPEAREQKALRKLQVMVCGGALCPRWKRLRSRFPRWRRPQLRQQRFRWSARSLVTGLGSRTCSLWCGPLTASRSKRRSPAWPSWRLTNTTCCARCSTQPRRRRCSTGAPMRRNSLCTDLTSSACGGPALSEARFVPPPAVLPAGVLASGALSSVTLVSGVPRVEGVSVATRLRSASVTCAWAASLAFSAASRALVRACSPLADHVFPSNIDR